MRRHRQHYSILSFFPKIKREILSIGYYARKNIKRNQMSLLFYTLNFVLLVSILIIFVFLPTLQRQNEHSHLRQQQQRHHHLPFTRIVKLCPQSFLSQPFMNAAASFCQAIETGRNNTVLDKQTMLLPCGYTYVENEIRRLSFLSSGVLLCH